jgi:hypothetical protein
VFSSLSPSKRRYPTGLSGSSQAVAKALDAQRELENSLNISTEQVLLDLGTSTFTPSVTLSSSEEVSTDAGSSLEHPVLGSGFKIASRIAK